MVIITYLPAINLPAFYTFDQGQQSGSVSIFSQNTFIKKKKKHRCEINVSTTNTVIKKKIISGYSIKVYVQHIKNLVEISSVYIAKILFSFLGGIRSV